jgi:hypothetical protein
MYKMLRFHNMPNCLRFSFNELVRLMKSKLYVWLFEI